MKDFNMLLTHIRYNFAAAFYPRLSEWVAASVTLGGGWLMTKNLTLMEASPRGYNAMLEIASQSTWASLFVLVGFARLLILLVNGIIKKSPWLRAGSAFISCALWMQLVSSFTSTMGWGLIMALGFLSMDYLNIMRSMMDARAVDEHIRKRNKSGIV